MEKRNSLKALALVTVLAGCASATLAPRVAVMPAPGKPFEQFVVEERTCRQYAEQSVGIGHEDPGARISVDSAVIGTAITAPFASLTSTGCTLRSISACALATSLTR